MAPPSFYTALVAAIILSISSLGTAVCSGNSQVINGWTYCQAVDRAVIQNVGHSGTYQETIEMDPKTGNVKQIPHAYSGPLAPLNEDLSVQMKGPLNLKRFAVFMPGNSNHKRAVDNHYHAHNHGRNHLSEHLNHRRHGHHATIIEEVDVYEKVIVDSSLCGAASTHTEYSTSTRRHVKETESKTSNVAVAKPTAKGQLAESKPHFTLRPFTEKPETTKSPESCQETCTTTVTAKGSAPKSQSSSSTSVATSSTQQSSSPAPATGGWSRKSYYNGDSKSSEGLVFLNTRGGGASGVWDSNFGSSLSYADASGDKAASSPTVFGGFLKDQFNEISIFTDTKCTHDLCGYSRPGAPAYYGFAGASKLFLIEYNMPKGTNPASDMPAIWFLNGHIDRIAQYASKSTTNCHSTGCGELDVFEILQADSSRLISTLHAKTGGGFSDYFVRPTEMYIKTAILMYNDTIVIQVLPDTFDMDTTSITQDQIDQLMSDDQWTSAKMSVLKLQS